jgi:hypothetical protein
MGGPSRSGESAARLHALAPAHVAHTAAAAPTLYWMTETAIEGPITFVWTREPTAESIELALEAPAARGIHAVDLAGLGLELETGAVYTWSVIAPVPGETADRELMTAGAIRRVERSREITRIAEGPRAARASAYAERGLWYDALEELSAAARTDVATAQVAEQRAALLEQVGLDEAAAWERARRSTTASPARP